MKLILRAIKKNWDGNLFSSFYCVICEGGVGRRNDMWNKCLQLKLIIQNSKHRTFVLLYDIKMNIFPICLENPLTNPCALRPITTTKIEFVVFIFYSSFLKKKVFIVNISCSWCWYCSNINSENLFLFWNLRESSSFIFFFFLIFFLLFLLYEKCFYIVQ